MAKKVSSGIYNLKCIKCPPLHKEKPLVGNTSSQNATVVLLCVFVSVCMML